jgi:hypothetical protein
MIRKCLVVFLVFIAVIFVIRCYGQEEENASVDLPRVIAVTISGGVRNEDTIDDPKGQFIPHLKEEIFKKGCLYTNLVDLNWQSHMPPISAIFTGRTYAWAYTLRMPSIFQYIRKKYGLPSEKLWSLGHDDTDLVYLKKDGFLEDTFPSCFNMKNEASADTWSLFSSDRIKELEESVEAYLAATEGGFFYWPRWDVVAGARRLLLEEIMEEFKPLFLHLAIRDVESAHYGTRGRYFLSIRRADAFIKYIWDFIQKDPFYSGKTYLIISSDHTRNKYYMHHNEGLFEDSSPVWLYIYGPKIKSGVEIDREIHHVDIFATLAWLYKLKVHENHGKILRDSFLE